MSADIELRRIRKLVDVGAGLVSFLPRPIAVDELLRPPLAIASARAEVSQGRVVADIADTLPRVTVDAPHTQEAMTAILSHAAARIKPGAELIVSTNRVARWSGDDSDRARRNAGSRSGEARSRAPALLPHPRSAGR